MKHLLLFAARESIQESSGFSAFEFIFVHTVRDLSFFKENLSSDISDCLNLFHYVSYLSIRLTKECDLAREHLKSNQVSMKKRRQSMFLVW